MLCYTLLWWHKECAFSSAAVVVMKQMVDLTAHNMVMTASKNRREWGEELTRILAGTGAQYAVRLLRHVALHCIALLCTAISRNLTACDRPRW